MAGRANDGTCLRQLVENMFRDVFTPDERAGLLRRIEAWEAANPGSSPHVRVTAWIDIAYEFQALQPVSDDSGVRLPQHSPQPA